MKPSPDPSVPEDPPGVPGFRTWPGFYSFVLAFFGLCVLLLVLFSRVFA